MPKLKSLKTLIDRQKKKDQTMDKKLRLKQRRELLQTNTYDHFAQTKSVQSFKSLNQKISKTLQGQILSNNRVTKKEKKKKTKKDQSDLLKRSKKTKSKRFLKKKNSDRIKQVVKGQKKYIGRRDVFKI